MRKGVVVNIDATSASIAKVLNDLQKKAQLKIPKASISLSGKYIQSFNSSGVVGIKGRVVKANDIENVVDAAKAVALSSEKKIIHVLPQGFKVDEQKGIVDPLGMMGVRLESKVHVITNHHSACQNVVHCCHRQAIEVTSLMASSLCSARSVLSADEIDLGTILIDIGAGTCDIAIFNNGSIQYSSVIDLGGHNITHDLAVGLRTPTVEAEKIKKQKLNLLSAPTQEEMIEIPSVGGQESRLIESKYLKQIVEPRVEEIFLLIKSKLSSVINLSSFGGGIVFTGGGTHLKGLVELAEYAFDLPVKKAAPRPQKGLEASSIGPEQATLIGLVLRESERRTFEEKNRHFVGKVTQGIRTWVDGLF